MRPLCFCHCSERQKTAKGDPSGEISEKVMTEQGTVVDNKKRERDRDLMVTFKPFIRFQSRFLNIITVQSTKNPNLKAGLSVTPIFSKVQHMCRDLCCWKWHLTSPSLQFSPLLRKNFLPTVTKSVLFLTNGLYNLRQVIRTWVQRWVLFLSAKKPIG